MKPSNDPDIPVCPVCAHPMRLARLTPRFGGLPELRSFECRACRVVLTLPEQDREQHSRPM